MSQGVEHSDGYAGNGTFLTGLLVGAAIGAGLAVLFAPKKGSELRGQLADSARRARESARTAYQQAAGAAGRMGEVAARTASDVGRTVRQMVGAGHGQPS